MTRQAIVETPRVKRLVRLSFVLGQPLVCGTSSCALSRHDCLWIAIRGWELRARSVCGHVTPG